MHEKVMKIVEGHEFGGEEMEALNDNGSKIMQFNKDLLSNAEPSVNTFKMMRI